MAAIEAVWLKSANGDEYALYGIRREVRGRNPSGTPREERLLRAYPSPASRMGL